jgi:uncharacterized protein YkwD
MPENHGCTGTPDSSGPDSVTPPEETTNTNDDGKNIREHLTLKNFTIVSIILLLIGVISLAGPQNNFSSVFKGIFEIGIICFILAYFLYAVKYWGNYNAGSAFLMVMIPLLVYFLSTSKIPGSTTNILLYLFIQICFYGILAVILLYISNKVKRGIERHIFQKRSQSYDYSSPRLSYVLASIIVVSLLVLNFGSITLLSDNTNTISHLLQRINSPAYATSAPDVVPIQNTSKNSPIVPTLQPEIVKQIESTGSNPALVMDIPTLEMRIHELINQQRNSNGLASMSYDSALASIARNHSADMALNNYFDHVNLQGLDPAGRGNRDGYPCRKIYGYYSTEGIGENIFQTSHTTTYYHRTVHDLIPMEDIAQSTVNGWMNSSGHRKNILTSTYDREGIGVAISSDNKIYVTENLC